MQITDLRFTNEMISELKKCIGRKLLHIRCNPFQFSKAIYGIVGIVTDIGSYCFTNIIESANLFGEPEDVAMFRVELTEEDAIISKVQNEDLINIPVNGTIDRIRLIEEHQEVFLDGVRKYDVWVTRGIIFDLKYGLEVSLEKAVWFSEMIYVDRGYDLLTQYSDLSDFEDDWQDGYLGKASRRIVELVPHLS